MNRILLPVFLALVCGAVASRAEFTAQTAQELVSAQADVYTDGSPESVERFVAFLAEDVLDVHVAYGREFTGKDHFRKNMPNKAKALVSYDRQVSQIVMGTNVAIVIFHEQSSEKKSDGSVKDYDGRTIMVLDFNSEGLVTQMRRYQD